ncbi:hypothetical protein CASFOL_008178 [Castilleja foliolosa]|uniref:Uncharacterized protein n=1 Tax=Castilleja foliolosa TaxID=1961234 RepID=A0ABD3DY81_9LAMI
MASDSNNTGHHNPRNGQHQQFVSATFKQGFIPDPFLSPSLPNSPSHPPNFRALSSPNQSPTLFQMMTTEKPREPKPSPENLKDNTIEKNGLLDVIWELTGGVKIIKPVSLADFAIKSDVMFFSRCM